MPADPPITGTSGEFRQPTPRGVIIEIQYLRFVAAILVVLTHVWELVPAVGRGEFNQFGEVFKAGACGVDIFFAISGFIMAVITAQRPTTWRQFLKNRMTRIAPPYWLLTTALVVAPSLFNSSKADAATYVFSMLFIAVEHPTLDWVQPLLQIGWTLNYEVFFYLVFAIALSVKFMQPIYSTAILLLTLVVLGGIIGPENPSITFYTAPIIIEFIFGMWIAKLYIASRVLQPKYAVLVGVTAVTMLIMGANLPKGQFDLNRLLYWGVPSALLLYSVVSMEGWLTSVPITFLKEMGDASYSLYLSHPFVVGVIRALCNKFQTSRHVSDVVLLLLGTVICVLAGWCFYHLIERPLITISKRIIDQRFSISPRTQKSNIAPGEVSPSSAE